MNELAVAINRENIVRGTGALALVVIGALRFYVETVE